MLAAPGNDSRVLKIELGGRQWPLLRERLVMVPVCGKESRTKGLGRSWVNLAECETTVKLVTKMVKEGVEERSISVLTTYSGQRNVISEYLLNRGLQEVLCSTVDSSQVRSKPLYFSTL